MKNNIDLLIGQGIGDQQPWAQNLEEKCRARGAFVWNEPLPHARCPLKETPHEWSELFRDIISPDLSAVLHSASVISFLDALLRKGEPIKNIIVLAAWLKDPVLLGGREGKMVKRVFTRDGQYLLQPFLNLVEGFKTRFSEIRTLIQNQIIVCHSLDDPYVALEQAEFLKQTLGGELLEVPNAGHFQLRPARKGSAPQNETLPQEVQQKIIELII